MSAGQQTLSLPADSGTFCSAFFNKTKGSVKVNKSVRELQLPTASDEFSPVCTVLQDVNNVSSPNILYIYGNPRGKYVIVLFQNDLQYDYFT